MKKVFIKIKGTQGLDGETDVVELSTEGTLRTFNGDYILTYSEEDTIAGKKTKTQLTVQNNNTVVLDRRGELTSRFVITKGERNSCLYSIPQGSLTLGIYGKNVTANLNEYGGTLKMSYSIDANLQPLSENTVEITVQER